MSSQRSSERRTSPKLKEPPKWKLRDTGKARRECLYAPDLADAAVFVMNLPDEPYEMLVNPGSSLQPLVNVGCGEDLTIAELAAAIAKTVGFTGHFTWDSSKLDGTPRKVTDVSKLGALGWKAKTSLAEGLRCTYEQVVAQLSSLATS